MNVLGLYLKKYSDVQVCLVSSLRLLLVFQKAGVGALLKGASIREIIQKKIVDV